MIQNHIISQFSSEIEKKILRENTVEIKDINNMEKYEKMFEKMAQTMKETSKMYSEFWQNLSLTEPDAKVLSKISMEVGEKNEKLKKEYFLLRKERFTSRISLLYLEYLTYIFQDADLLEIVKDRLKETRKLFLSTTNFDDVFEKKIQEGYDKNYQESLLKIEVIGTEIDIVNYCSGDVYPLLGISKQNLLRSKASVLIPNFFKEIHQNLVEDFFTSKKTELD